MLKYDSIGSELVVLDFDQNYCTADLFACVPDSADNVTAVPAVAGKQHEPG